MEKGVENISDVTKEVSKLNELIGDSYQVTRRLGLGGMGAVYAARCHKSGRTVALKILCPTSGSDLTPKARFKREFRLCAALDNPLVIKHYDMGELADGRLFITMEYLEHGSLRQVIDREGALEEKRVLSLSIELARALSVVHKNGLIHRDLKPDNILLRKDGTPILVDFGLALAPDLTALTKTGYIVGTPVYMPLEAFEGHVEERSDIYSLGAVIYEMLSAQPPFCSQNIAVLHNQIRYEKPAPIKNSGLQQRDLWEAIIDKCLAKDLSNRFANALELQKALEKLQKTIGRKPKSTKKVVQPIAPMSPQSNRHRVFIALAVLFTLFCIFVLTRPGKNSQPRNDEQFFDEASDWYLLRKGFHLRFPAHIAKSPAWSLRTKSNEQKEGSFKRTGNVWELTLVSLEQGEKYFLLVKDGNKELGKTSFVTPKSQLREPVRARFGLNWLELNWRLFGSGTTEVAITGPAIDDTEKTTRKDSIRFVFPHSSRRARKVSYVLKGNGVELAQGSGVLGLSERSKFDLKFKHSATAEFHGDKVLLHMERGILALAYLDSPFGPRLERRSYIQFPKNMEVSFLPRWLAKEILFLPTKKFGTFRRVHGKRFAELWSKSEQRTLANETQISLGADIADHCAFEEILSDSDLTLMTSKNSIGTLYLWAYDWKSRRFLKPTVLATNEVLGVASLSSSYVVAGRLGPKTIAYQIKIDNRKLTVAWSNTWAELTKSHTPPYYSFAICTNKATGEVIVVSGQKALCLKEKEGGQKIDEVKLSLPIKSSISVANIYPNGKSGFIVGTTRKLASYMERGFRVGLVTIDTRFSPFLIKYTQLRPSIGYDVTKIGKWGMVLRDKWMYINAGNHFMQVSNSHTPLLRTEFPHFFTSRSKPFAMKNSLFILDSNRAIYGMELCSQTFAH